MTGDIARGSALGKALDGYSAPALPEGFADRVLAATKDRPEPLPEPRKPAGGGGAARWRSARRVAVGLLAAGALGTAAAATGLLEDLGVELPSAGEVWSTITGQDPAPAAVAPAVQQPPALVPEVREPVVIEGPIDTPEELEEAFRRIDEFRGNRKETRRSNVDQRIDNTIERRREQGLPAPTPEQEARLKDRIEKFRERRDQRVEERLEGRRDEMREQIENGEEFTPRELIEGQRDIGSDTPVGDRLERLREMTPEQRREAIRRFRERRQERLLRRGTNEDTPIIDARETVEQDQTSPDESDVPADIEAPDTPAEPPE